MSSTKFTEEQKQAIYTRNCDLLVAAAAGSGKTAVLVERIIDLITDEKKPVDIDRLLVVTFTDAAAGEMRRRISDALYNMLEHRDSPHLKRQITLISKARITTIHSFCLSVVRSNFNTLDLDPSFKIADSTELNLIQSDVINEIFEEEYEKNSREFSDLVDAYGGGGSRDDALKKLTLEVYRLIVSAPWPEQVLDGYLKMFPLDSTTPLEKTVWADILLSKIRMELSVAYFAAQRALELCCRPQGPQHYYKTIAEDLEILQRLLALCDEPQITFEKLYNAFSESGLPRLSGKKNADCLPEAIEEVKTIRDKEIKVVFKKISQSVFIKSPTLMLKDLVNVRPAMETLCGLTLSFMERYAQAKKSRNIADFNDIEHYCLRVLLEPGTDTPTEIAQSLKNKFVEVYTDEYQDSSPIQELILSAVSKNGGPQGLPNRFMVGDVKQSIYKFRRAEPGIFLDKYKSFSKIQGLPHLKIDLSKNFRSRESVLNVVNFLFRQLMYKEFSGISYDEDAALHPGATFPPGASEATEILISLYAKPRGDMDEDFEEITSIEQEARMIAQRIWEMVSGPSRFQVWDGETYRPAEYRDIVILLRSVGNDTNSLSKGSAIERALKSRDIPAFMNTGGSYFNSLEVATALSFLRVIDNPRQDIDLLAVLRSPTYMFDMDELLEIKNIPLDQGEKDVTFYDRLVRYEEIGESPETLERIGRFLFDLNRWRDLAAGIKVSRLLNIIYEESGYYNYAGALPGGLQRQANLHALLEKASDYENTSYHDLYHFIAYVERIMKTRSDSNLGDAKILSDHENLVRIMTIHKSKGLEFPIVFVSMLGGQFNPSDERGALVTHPTLGLGPSYVDLEARVRSKTPANIALAHKIRSEGLAEELRVLYVALTRAKEKLVLTGSVQDIEAARRKWSRSLNVTETEIPIPFMFSAANSLDWICSAVARHRDGSVLATGESAATWLYKDDARFEISVKTGEDIKEAQSQSLPVEPVEEPESVEIDEETQRVEELFAWEYPGMADVYLPTKISISEIKRVRQMLEERDELPGTGFDFAIPEYHKAFVLPDFSELTAPGGTKFTAAQRGTIIHSVMEHLDVHKHSGKDDVRGLIELLVKKNILTAEEAGVVPVHYILNFLKSETAKRMRAAEFIKKETPFVMGVEAREIFENSNSREIILVHGIIDLYFGTGNSITLVDYKTDRVEDSLEEIRRKYRLQLALYKKALERSAGVEITESIIFLLAPGRELFL